MRGFRQRPAVTTPDAWGRPTAPGVFDVGVNVRLTRDIGDYGSMTRGTSGCIERGGRASEIGRDSNDRIWWVLFGFSTVARPVFEDEMEVV